jgi:hypothetical protein
METTAYGTAEAIVTPAEAEYQFAAPGIGAETMGWATTRLCPIGPKRLIDEIPPLSVVLHSPWTAALLQLTPGDTPAAVHHGGPTDRCQKTDK